MNIKSKRAMKMASLISLISIILFLVFLLLYIVAFVKVFQKLGLPSWSAIIPIYNLIVLFKTLNISLWYLLLYFVPIISLITHWYYCRVLAKVFGRETGFTIGLFLIHPIFVMILGFSDSEKANLEFVK
jgi:hypothetical protein